MFILNAEGSVLINTNHIAYFTIQELKDSGPDQNVIGYSVLAYLAPVTNGEAWVRMLKCDTRLEAEQYLIELHKGIYLTP